MILSNLKNCEELASINERFKELFNFIKDKNLKELPKGRNEIDDDNVFLNHDIVDGRVKEHQMLEMHRKYIDVHILLSGEETIGIKSVSKVKNITIPYNEEKDFSFADELADEYFKLNPGDILVAYPDDAHAPIIGNGKIEKLIGKIKV